jgi:hypothetical protein
MTRIKLIVILALLVILLGSFQSFGSDKMKEDKITEPLSEGLDHLISQIDSGNTVAFDAKKIDKVLDFLTAPKQASTLYYPEEKFNSTSIYFEFDINTSMKKLLQYAYNRDLPAYIFNPSSIRLSYWPTVASPGNRLPYFYDYLPNLTSPVVIKGVEYTEITPDLNTGAYYKYNDLRSLILLKYKGKNVFISMSRQKDISSPSMKGLILDDTNWDYLYSGIQGHTKFGLGWTDSFMYDSFSIVVYYETDPKKPVLRCGVFKWLRAGWKNVNMVKREHIYGGVKRYARDVKIIMENPLLPDFNDLKDNISKINDLPLDVLREKTGKYLNAVKKKYNNNELMSRREFRDLFTSDNYINHLTKKEMEATLIMDYVKNILGKKSISY